MAVPLLKWPGGKRWLAPKIAPFVRGEFNRYFEPFLGGGAFLFALEPAAGVVSDINPDLISCYQAIKGDPIRVLTELKKLRPTKTAYYQIRDHWKPTNNFRRAARMIYLLQHSWNGLYRVNRGGDFNVPYCARVPKHPLDEEMLFRAQAVLLPVDLRHQHFGQVIKQTRQGDLIFIDPPYFMNGRDIFRRYSPAYFSENDQALLASLLITAEKRGASWILTNGSATQLQRHFKNRKIFTVVRSSCIAASPQFRGQIKEYILLSRAPALNRLRRFLASNCAEELSSNSQGRKCNRRG